MQPLDLSDLCDLSDPCDTISVLNDPSGSCGPCGFFCGHVSKFAPVFFPLESNTCFFQPKNMNGKFRSFRAPLQAPAQAPP